MSGRRRLNFSFGERLYTAKGEPTSLLYVCEDPESKPRQRKVVCKCDYNGCGKTKSFFMCNIRSGLAKTCDHKARYPLEARKKDSYTKLHFQPGERLYTAKGEPSFLIYVGEDVDSKPHQRRLICKCDYNGCGKIKSLFMCNIRSGVSRTCGHEDYRVKQIVHSNSKHGCCKLPEYRLWLGMKSRCCNPKTRGYKPVPMYPQWYSPKVFISYIRSLPPGKQAGPGMYMTRINRGMGFEPGNIEFRHYKVGSS